MNTATLEPTTSPAAAPSAPVREFPPVPDLQWSEALQTGDARMDATHQEMGEMLARLRAPPPEQQLEPYRALLAHTTEHFAQEDRWMLASGFTADNCHSLQHKSVLDTLIAVEAHFHQGDRSIITRMAEALVEAVTQATVAAQVAGRVGVVDAHADDGRALGANHLHVNDIDAVTCGFRLERLHDPQLKRRRCHGPSPRQSFSTYKRKRGKRSAPLPLSNNKT